MRKLWPFANRNEELKHAIKSLENKLDERDIENEIQEIERKTYQTTDSSQVNGIATVVDEYFDKAMLQRLYASETWFYIAVWTIAKTISSLPIKVEKKKVVKETVNGKEVQKVTWVDASGEPEYALLNNPNRLYTPFEFWSLIVIDLLATGDAFIYVDKGDEEDQSLLDISPSANRLQQAVSRNRRNFDVRGLYRINAALIQPKVSAEDNRILDGYTLNSQDGVFTFSTKEIIHIKLPNPFEPFFGLAPIIPVMKKVLLDRYTDEHMIRFYKQGARLGGVIKTDKKLTKDQMIRLERVFESNFTGKRNHHKTLILPEGMDYSTIEQNPGETSLIEFSKANKEPILAAYNLPPVKVGILDGATYANAVIQDKTYYTDTVKPYCTILEQAISNHGSIFSFIGDTKFSFDMSGIECLKENEAEKGNLANAMLNTGLSVNEVRERVWKMPPVDGGKIVPAIEKNKQSSTPFFFPGKSAEVTETKVDANNNQNDLGKLSEIKPTDISFDDRVAEIANAAIQGGVDPTKAIQDAIKQALLEGFKPIFDDNGEVKLHNEMDEVKFYNFTKGQIRDHLKKMTGDDVAPMINSYKKSVDAYMKKLEGKIISNLKKNLKKDLKIKAVDLLLESEIETYSDDEAEEYVKHLLKAMEYGYKQSIPSRSLTFPNEEAQKSLREIGAKKIKYITETTRKQINDVVASAYEEQVGVNEIVARIRETFDGISKGRAETIARTETLTAVSVGQQQKLKDFRDQFPEESKTMKKVWVSAQDERVRDSHIDLDGVAIGIDEEFKSGLAFPRDPNCEDPSEVINCRCTTIEYFPEDEKEIKDTMEDGSPLADAVEEKGGPGSGRHSEGGPKEITAKDATNKMREFSNDEKDSLQEYKGDSSNINNSLRDGDSLNEYQQKIVSNIDSAFENSSLKEETTLYRLVQGGGDYSKFNVGDTITDKAFISTSTKLSILQNSIDEYDLGSKSNIVLKIKAPSGSNAINMEEFNTGYARGDNQEEILLPRNSNFKITGIKDSEISGGGKEYEVELITTKKKGGPGSGRKPRDGSTKPNGCEPAIDRENIKGIKDVTEPLSRLRGAGQRSIESTFEMGILASKECLKIHGDSNPAEMKQEIFSASEKLQSSTSKAYSKALDVQASSSITEKDSNMEELNKQFSLMKNDADNFERALSRYYRK